MRGRVGALCLSSSQRDSVGLDERQRDLMEPDESSCDEDKHKAPSSTLLHPLSLQDARAASVPMITAFGR
jgi:hypothetical protein